MSSTAYLTSLTAANLISGFRRTGIYPINKEAYDDTVLLPSVALQELGGAPKDHTVKPANASIDQETQNTEEDVGVINTASHNNDECPIDGFLNKRITKAKEASDRKISKPRRTLSKVTSGKTITEDSTLNKIKEFKEQSESKKKQRKSENDQKKGKSKEMNENTPKKQKSSKKQTNTKTSKADLSPRPSTSGLVSGKQGPLEVEDSIELSEEESDNEPCCICNQHYPPQLKHVVSLTIINWAQCEACGHWTHLRYCSTVNVVRSKSKFRCPHCEDC